MLSPARKGEFESSYEVPLSQIVPHVSSFTSLAFKSLGLSVPNEG